MFLLRLVCVRGRELRVGRAPRVCAKVSLHTRVVPTKHTSCGRQGPSGTRPMHAHGHSSLYSSEAKRTRLWCAAERERRGHDRAHLEGLVRLRRACTCAQRGARAPADRPGVAGLRRASCAPASPASHPVRPHRTAAATRRTQQASTATTRDCARRVKARGAEPAGCSAERSLSRQRPRGAGPNGRRSRATKFLAQCTAAARPSCAPPAVRGQAQQQ